MSPSDAKVAASRPTGSLIVTGPPGVEIQVLDGNFNLAARGSNSLKADLPEGIYVIKWLAGGQVHQEIHRLFAIAEPLRLPQGDLPSEIQGGTLAVAAVAGQPPRAPSGATWRAGEADIVVFVRAERGVDFDAAELESLRVFNAKDVAMRFDPVALSAEPTSVGTLSATPVRLYHVSRGDHRIRFRSMSGASVEQTIPALPDRRTLVFLQLTSCLQLNATGSAAPRLEKRVGVNEAATRIVTVASGTTALEGAEQIRLAELLQHALATNGNPLDAGTFEVLSRSETDPLMKLAAAALILLRLEQGETPGLENEVFSADDMIKIAAKAVSVASGGLGSLLMTAVGHTLNLRHIVRDLFEQTAKRARDVRWRSRARDLIQAADPDWGFSDAIVMAWKLKAGGGPWSTPIPTQLSEPPLFEPCWRWAVAESASRPEAVPNTRSIRAPSRGRTPAGPWLAWRASAAKELRVRDGTPDYSPAAPGRTESLVQRLTETARSLDASASRNADQSRAILSTLSVETRRLMANTENASAQGGTLTQKLNRLSAALSAPSLVVQAQAAAAERELTAAVSDGQRLTDDPPALQRPVTCPDDPNKGRFGRRAARKGFTLSATFDEVTSEWVRMTLTVIADGRTSSAEGLTAEFFLHDTFRPHRYVEAFVGDRAQLEITTWGGFTAGVWIADQRIELELDLAEIEGAPAVIREL